MYADRPFLQHLHHLGTVLAALSGWFVLLALIFVPLERLFALRPGKIFRAELLADVGYYFLNAIVPALVLAVPLGWVAHRMIPAGLTTAFAHWPVGLRLFTSPVVAEIGLYWGHRWCHEVPLLWRFHAVHHRPTHIDWLVNSRAHPVDFIFTRLCGLVPLYALGLGNPVDANPGETTILVVFLGPIWGFFIHVSIKWRFGKLEWPLATPAFHHWHHANDGPRQELCADVSLDRPHIRQPAFAERSSACGLWHRLGGRPGYGRATERSLRWTASGHR
jgi:sterol desaturase/sphingolipid hydroxylase (fatty acid hydroxylase superfamily)